MMIFGYSALEKNPVMVRSRKLDIRPADIAYIVGRVSRFVPGALCLAQAASAQRQLAKYGYKTTMKIGVKSDSNGSLLAHAWLMYQDSII